MASGPFSPHHASPGELKEQFEAERRRAPFLVHRGAGDEQVIRSLDTGDERVRVGRDPKCELCLDAGPFVTPACNKEIAAEVSLSVDRVKAHLGTLFELLGVEALAQHHKRARLAELALRSGLVTRRELTGP